MRVVPRDTPVGEQERTILDLGRLLEVAPRLDSRIIRLYTGAHGLEEFNRVLSSMKKQRGKDKKPRKKPKGSTPLQKAQRMRQSILFPISGATGNLMYNLSRMNNHKMLFTPEEYEAGKKLYMALDEWLTARQPDAWEKVKQNLAASVDNPPEIV